MADVVGARLQRFNTRGSMGVVTNTRYIRCFWPVPSRPTRLFAEGSSGIEVEGPPTPRNIIFPPGTVFLNGTRGDCFFRGRRIPGPPDSELDPMEDADNRVEISRQEAEGLAD